MPVGTRSRRWTPASTGTSGGPQADAIIDHPAPDGNWVESEGVPFWIAPDPGGIAPFAGSVEYLVEAPQTPVQHSPLTNWNPGSPYPGPAATVTKYVDMESMRWWGKTGQGKLVWSEGVEFSANLPPAIPWDLPQHVDNFQGFWGGYPSIVRNRPPAFGDQVAQLGSPAAPVNFDTSLPPG